MRAFVIFFILLIVNCALLFAEGSSKPGTIAAVRVTISPTVDGVLNDDVWKEAVPITNFTQRELHEGAPATERTEVKIVFDDHGLYVGIACFDSDMEGIIANELKRDFPYEVEDDFEIILDTYHDKRNGFLFVINPRGARFDALITDEGQGINQDWNGVWDVQTHISADGWSAEIEIPFSSLRFSDDNEQIWGINFERNIRRKREQLLWQGYLRNYELERLSQAGVLTGLANVHRGHSIEVKPYALGGVQHDAVASTNTGQLTQSKAGVDVKYGISPTLTLDATVNTDFAQVEADRVRINLTRFPLLFPEKREFFLEGADIFNFQLGESTLPFYSRRIGISSTREPLQVLAGVRVAGKLGNYNVGILTMETDRSAGEPTTNYAVARLKRDLSDQSYVGMIATNKQSSMSWNRLLGIDGAWVRSDVFGTNTLIVGGGVAGTANPGVHSNNLAYRVYADYPNSFMDHFIGIKEVQRNFDPQVGFVERTDFRQYSWAFRIRPRPQGIGVQYFEFKPVELEYYVSPNGRMQTVFYEARPLGFATNSGETFECNFQRLADNPQEGFEIFRNVIIPPSTYWWSQWEFQLETNPSRDLSCEISYSWGGFYNGKRQGFDVTPKVKVGGHLILGLDYARNQVRLPQGSFVTNEAAATLDYGFSTRLNSSVFAQWNSEERDLNINWRIHWIPEIGSDVYLVYNHLMGTTARLTTVRATILAKVAYRFVI